MTALEIAMAGYLAFGQPTENYYEAITKHSGLQVIHADGAVTLRLREEGRETREEGTGKREEDVSRITVIRLKDERYPFEVTRYVRTWKDCAAVETWAEIRHEERGTGNGEWGTVDAVVFALGLKIEGEYAETLHLRGLDPESMYSIKEINCGERLHLEGGAQSSATVSGRDLMECGLAVMLSGDYDSAVFEICRQEAAAAVAAGCCTVVRPGYDTLIAPRGESEDAPDNTLPAYRMAVESMGTAK